MILHSFLTDGFFPWAKIYLESFKFHHGEDIHIVLCTVNLSRNQINDLHGLYNNLNVINKFIDIQKVSDEWGLDLQTVLKYKEQIEKVHVTDEARIWKQFISADKRIRSIYDVMKIHKDKDYLLHSDIDIYFRTNLKRLFKLIRNNEISIRFRLNSSLQRKVMGGIIGFKLDEKVFSFMERWIKYLDDVPIVKRKEGYGQTSFYLTYKDFESEYKWGDIPISYISPHMKPKDQIWSANNTKGKTENLKRCYGDFDKIKGAIK